MDNSLKQLSALVEGFDSKIKKWNDKHLNLSHLLEFRDKQDHLVKAVNALNNLTTTLEKPKSLIKNLHSKISNQPQK